ncbi:MAG: hypothetical protein H6807_12380 [Planctomycetes bacterium]|nr:hypothetical protein [Planctomycetota bacterium]
MRARLAILVLVLLGLAAIRARGQGSTDLEGFVRWQGKPFPAREVLWPQGSRGHDVVLEKLVLGRRLLDESLVVDAASQGIRDVLIRLPEFQLPRRDAEELELLVEGLTIRPRVITLRKRSRLFLRNADPLDLVFLSRDADGKELRHVLPARSRIEVELPAGEGFDLVAERFPFLAARVRRVGDEPAIITAIDGRFAVKGLAAQEIVIEFEHALLGQGRKTVTLEEGSTTRLELHQDDFVRPVDVDEGSPFAETGEAVFRIEGLRVPRADFDAVVDYLDARHQRFRLPRAILQAHALRQVLVPLAATWVHHRGDLAALRERAVEVDRALARGESFEELARRLVASGRSATFGPVGRQDLDPWLGHLLFATPRHLKIGPIWSTRGLHYFYLDQVLGDGADERRAGFQIYFPWPGNSAEGQADHLRALAERARVEALDPRLESLVDQSRTP